MLQHLFKACVGNFNELFEFTLHIMEITVEGCNAPRRRVEELRGQILHGVMLLHQAQKH